MQESSACAGKIGACQRFAILGPSSAVWLAAYFAVLSAGRVIVPLHDGISANTRLVGEPGMSSFVLAETVVSVEETYGVKIPDERFRELETVADIIRIIREENAL